MKFIHDNEKISGLAVPLLSLKVEGGACGEFPDIAPLARLARRWDMGIIQLLPVNDTGWQTSPYSALSAFALNPVYLRIEELPEIAGGAGTPQASVAARNEAVGAAHRLAAEFGNAKKVPYHDILARKLEILGGLWKDLAGQGGLLAEVETWVRDNAWVRPYACFVELKRRFGGKPWWEWPRHRDPDGAHVDALWNSPEFSSDIRFWAWLQMRAKEQFVRACSEARENGIDIMGDIPILMNADSADVWFDRGLFDTELSAGAPPDMYSHLGQNWGFPLYRWDEIERRSYEFWKNRLAYADKFYTSYRIDHVLGFFRIWAIGTHEQDGFLGRFVPEFSLSYPELAGLGFDSARIRWLSKPHVPQSAIDGALSGLPDAVRLRIMAGLFVQIGNEPLYLFAPAIRGGGDIAAAIRAAGRTGDTLPSDRGEASSDAAFSACGDAMMAWWRNRALYEYAPGQFVPSWEYHGTTAWNSLSGHEKSLLEALISRRKAESLILWEKTGRKTLKTLVESVGMKACAEDLGAVPPCVPSVLEELGIPGLRVLRWNRKWDREGSPYVPFDEYPENSVACISVHDSTNLRQWWREEADRDALWAMAIRAIGDAGSKASPTPPEDLDPGSVFFILKAFATVRSKYVIHPLQDILAASATYREENPADERINVPGTTDGANWLYRTKIGLEDLLADDDFAARVGLLSKARAPGTGEA